MYLLDHYNLKWVDIQNVSPLVHGYMQDKRTTAHCKALEQLLILEGFEPVVVQGRCFTRLASAIGIVQRLREYRGLVIGNSENHLAWDLQDFQFQSRNQKLKQKADQLCDYMTPAKYQLFERHRDELKDLHVKQYAERLVVPDQWCADPWYFWRHLRDTVLGTQHAKHEAEYTKLMKRHRQQLVHTSEYGYEVEQEQVEANKRNRTAIRIE